MKMNNLYIELDGLFDTRLVILNAINEEIGTMIFNTTYNSRTNDKFGIIPTSVFNTYYKQRKKDVLTYALPTYIYNVIDNITTDYYADLKNNDGLQKLYINTYPYHLEETEIKKLKENLYYLKKVDIEFITVSDNDLTPGYLESKNIFYMIKYNGIEWLELQSRLLNISDNPMLDKYLYVPAIFDDTYVDKKIKPNKDFFKGLTRAMGIVINLVFTDIVYWNTIKK